MDEMDSFLDRYQLPKFNHDQIDHINGPLNPKEIEVFIDSHPTKKSTRPDSFSAEFSQTFKEDLTPILLKHFRKQKQKEHYPTRSMKPQFR